MTIDNGVNANRANPAGGPSLHVDRQLIAGDWQLDLISGGRFSMDGGVLFGVVPKRLWQTVAPPDEQNRVPCDCHCILARNGRQTVLIDAGYGGKQSPLDRKFYDLQAGDPVVERLASLNVEPGEIDVVLLSHLHWDHAGGTTRRDAGRRLVPTFPLARHAVGRIEWEDALSGADELGCAYPPEHILPLRDLARVETLEGGDEVAPGIRVHLTGGHTRGHMAVTIGTGPETVVFLGDLCPSSVHLRPLWALAYDTFPLDARREKPRWLNRAADEGWTIAWSHDPVYAASRITRVGRGGFKVVEAWSAAIPATSAASGVHGHTAVDR